MVSYNHYEYLDYVDSFYSSNLKNNDFVKFSLMYAEDKNKISIKKLNKMLNQLLNNFNNDQLVKEILEEIIKTCCLNENYEAAIYFRDNLELITKN